jgi:hypothetical protein
VYANRDQPKLKAARWVQVTVPTLSLPPHATTAVGFTVQVPAGAPAGDHLVGIAFEDAHRQHSGAHFSVTEVIREVVGVQVRVPGPGRFHVHVDGVDLRRLAGVGTGAVIVHVGDDGLRLGKPRLCVSLVGPHGYRHAVSAHLDTILPGDTIPYPLPWPDTLTVGDYTVRISTACGSAAALFQGQVHLGTALKGSRPAPSTHTSTSQFPWLLLIATALGGVLVGIVIVRRPRRRSRRRRPRPLAAAADHSDDRAAVGTRGPSA